MPQSLALNADNGVASSQKLMPHTDWPCGGFGPLFKRKVGDKSACWLEDLGTFPGVQMAHVVVQDLPAGLRTVHMEVPNPPIGV